MGNAQTSERDGEHEGKTAAPATVDPLPERSTAELMQILAARLQEDDPKEQAEAEAKRLADMAEAEQKRAVVHAQGNLELAPKMTASLINSFYKHHRSPYAVVGDADKKVSLEEFSLSMASTISLAPRRSSRHHHNRENDDARDRDRDAAERKRPGGPDAPRDIELHFHMKVTYHAPNGERTITSALAMTPEDGESIFYEGDAGDEALLVDEDEEHLRDHYPKLMKIVEAYREWAEDLNLDSSTDDTPKALNLTTRLLSKGATPLSLELNFTTATTGIARLAGPGTNIDLHARNGFATTTGVRVKHLRGMPSSQPWDVHLLAQRLEHRRGPGFDNRATGYLLGRLIISDLPVNHALFRFHTFGKHRFAKKK